MGLGGHLRAVLEAFIPAQEMARKQHGLRLLRHGHNARVGITPIAHSSSGDVVGGKLGALLLLLLVGALADPQEHLGVRVEQHDILGHEAALGESQNLLRTETACLCGQVEEPGIPREVTSEALLGILLRVVSGEW